jgi:hypothetical protein
MNYHRPQWDKGAQEIRLPPSLAVVEQMGDVDPEKERRAPLGFLIAMGMAACFWVVAGVAVYALLF